jgi:hypothetical protein
MPATLIAGIFGMNFREMPWLADLAGFPMPLAVWGDRHHHAAAILAATFRLSLAAIEPDAQALCVQFEIGRPDVE